MIKRILFSVAMLLISKEIFGQSGFYVGLSGTYSFIPKTEIIENILLPNLLNYATQAKITKNFDVKPGFNIGLGYNKQLIEKFSISAGAEASFIRYQRVLSVEPLERTTANPEVNNGVSVGSFYSAQPGGIYYEDIDFDSNDNATVFDNSNDGKTKILYLAIPVKIHYSLIPKRFKIGIGVTNNFIVYSSQLKSLFIFSDPRYVTQQDYNDKSGVGLRNYQLNGSFSLEYRVLQDIWIQADYDHGFLSIYDNRGEYTATNKARYRTVELGLKYEL